MEKASEYCITTCKAKCCKRGKLPLLAEERKMFNSNRIDEHGFYDLSGGCEYLDENFKCKLYNKRPKMCRDYPFHQIGPIKFATTLCEGVVEGIFDEEIEKRNVKKL